MKSKYLKDKALGMYINNTAINRIANEINVQALTIRTWVIKHNWKQVRENTIKKVADNQPDIYGQIIKDQIKITQLAHKELIYRLKNNLEDFRSSDLIAIQKHGLEVVRPKTTTQVNFMKQDNINVKFELTKLLQASQDGLGI